MSKHSSLLQNSNSLDTHDVSMSRSIVRVHDLLANEDSFYIFNLLSQHGKLTSYELKRLSKMMQKSSTYHYLINAMLKYDMIDKITKNDIDYFAMSRYGKQLLETDQILRTKISRHNSRKHSE